MASKTETPIEYELDAGEHSPEDLPGLNDFQIEQLTHLANTAFDQGSGLMERIKAAQQKVAKNPALMPDPDTRAKFVGQAPAVAAAVTCSTAARYLYLLALRMLTGCEVATFEDFYIRGVVGGGLGMGKTSRAYCVVQGWPAHVDWVKEFSEGVKCGAFTRGEEPNQFRTDMEMIAELKRRGWLLCLLRDGLAGAGTHSSLVVLAKDGTYRIIDTWFRDRTGDVIESRFGPGRPRYVHAVLTYHDDLAVPGYFDDAESD